MLNKIEVYNMSDLVKVERFSIEWKSKNALILSVFKKDCCIAGVDCIDDYSLLQNKTDGAWYCKDYMVVERGVSDFKSDIKQQDNNNFDLFI